MDSEAIFFIAMIVIVAAVVIVVFTRSKRAGRVNVDLAKGQISAETQAEGASVKDALSREGGITAKTETGAPAAIERVEAQKDIRAEVKSPKR